MKINRLLAATLLAVVASHAAMAQEAPPDVTRSEVLADLQIYRESGLDSLDRAEGAYVFSEPYTQAEAKYMRLRASPYYTELVQRIAAQRGEVITSAKR